MYTDIILIAYATWATKLKAKANISSRKLFLTGQKIAGNSGLDMLLYYVTQDKIFSFPKHLPTKQALSKHEPSSCPSANEQAGFPSASLPTFLTPHLHRV